jgi:segregation and condensation protein B
MDASPGSESLMESTDTAMEHVEVKPAAEPHAESADGLKPSGLLTVQPAQVAPTIEAILLSMDKPVSGPRLAEALGLVHDAEDAEDAERIAARTIDASESSESAATPGDSAPRSKKRKTKTERAQTPLGLISACVALLNDEYEKTGRVFRIEQIAGGYRLMTLAKFATALEQFHGKRERHTLSRAAMESLAIIAYKQPITRAGLEAIRGVACGEVLRSLLERRLIAIVGRAEEVGRPMLYGTSKAFLETFGLASVKDLPSVEELKNRARDED